MVSVIMYGLLSQGNTPLIYIFLLCDTDRDFCQQECDKYECDGLQITILQIV